MVEHMNVFQRLINQSVSLDIPLADKVLVLLLLGVHPNSWDTLMMTLGNSILEGKLTLDTQSQVCLVEKQDERSLISYRPKFSSN